jgi:hypothetical protein
LYFAKHIGWVMIGDMNSTLIAITLLGIAFIVLVVWIIILERRIGRLIAGKNGASLEDAINKNQQSIDELFQFRKAVEVEMNNLDVRIKKKIHGAKTLRFNPFAGTGSGGNQSFATALLNEEGDGVVISSLYSREKVSVFAKPIKGRASEFELTEEEREVLK